MYAILTLSQVFHKVPLLHHCRETLEEMETYYRQREDRLKTVHSELVEELETRIETMHSKMKSLNEMHKEELDSEKERRKRDLAEQSDEHAEAMQMLKSEYTVALDRIRELKAVENEAGEDAERASK